MATFLTTLETWLPWTCCPYPDRLSQLYSISSRSTLYTPPSARTIGAINMWKDSALPVNPLPLFVNSYPTSTHCRSWRSSGRHDNSHFIYCPSLTLKSGALQTPRLGSELHDLHTLHCCWTSWTSCNSPDCWARCVLCCKCRFLVTTADAPVDEPSYLCCSRR